MDLRLLSFVQRELNESPNPYAQLLDVETRIPNFANSSPSLESALRNYPSFSHIVLLHYLTHVYRGNVNPSVYHALEQRYGELTGGQSLPNLNDERIYSPRC